MTKKPAPKAAPADDVHPEIAKLAKLFASDKRVSLARSFSSVALNVGGRIFAMIVRGNLVVKLPKARVDELVEAGAATRFDPGHGRLMKEWAVFDGNKSKWAGLAREAHAYVGSL